MKCEKYLKMKDCSWMKKIQNNKPFKKKTMRESTHEQKNCWKICKMRNYLTIKKSEYSERFKNHKTSKNEKKIRKQWNYLYLKMEKYFKIIKYEEIGNRAEINNKYLKM